MRRDEGDKERQKALVEGCDWAPMGTRGPDGPFGGADDYSARTTETAGDAEGLEDGRGWFRTSDLSRVKRALSH